MSTVSIIGEALKLIVIGGIVGNVYGSVAGRSSALLGDNYIIRTTGLNGEAIEGKRTCRNVNSGSYTVYGNNNFLSAVNNDCTKDSCAGDDLVVLDNYVIVSTVSIIGEALKLIVV